MTGSTKYHPLVQLAKHTPSAELALAAHLRGYIESLLDDSIAVCHIPELSLDSANAAALLELGCTKELLELFERTSKLAESEGSLSKHQIRWEARTIAAYLHLRFDEQSKEKNRPAARVKFSFYGEDLDPDEVTRLLHIPPDQAWRPNQPRLRRNPEGDIEENGFPKSGGYWQISSRDWLHGGAHAPLRNHVIWLLDLVEHKRDTLEHIARQGAAGSVTCINTQWDELPMHLPHDLQNRLEMLPVSIYLWNAFYGGA
jgi:hypothetical protein